MQNYRNTVLGKAYIIAAQVFSNYIPQSSIHGGTFKYSANVWFEFYFFFKCGQFLIMILILILAFFYSLSLRIQFSVDLVLCCA